MTLGAMTFLPFVRSGLANQISSFDHDASVVLRATARVSLELRGVQKADGAIDARGFYRDVQLIGPGDIVGLDRRAIIRTEPLAGITNFEPNYLAFVEFYDEDLPWRYTPAKPTLTQPHRLRPWLTLVVLKEGEFSDEPYNGTQPLPAIKVLNTGAFPPEDDMAGWAHVHCNGALVTPTTVKSTDGAAAAAAVAAALQAAVSANPDIACSRLVCPRKLEDNTAYHAFLVPTFESGRLAGLGLDVTKTPNATHGSWTAYPTGTNTGTKESIDVFPFYHRYYFRTGGPGDFEYLVRLLKPKPVDNRVGRRPIDTRTPGWGLQGVTHLGGVLKLGGALRAPPASLSPAQKLVYDQEEGWDAPYPHAFQEDLARFVNLSDAYTVTAAQSANGQAGLTAIASDPDPMVTPPIYGRWHALTQRLLYTRTGGTAANTTNWLHNLNLDPRHRIAASLGTGVIQKDQENLMRAAWAQVGDVIEANRILRLSQLSAAVSYSAYNLNIAPLAEIAPERALMMTAPLQARIMVEGATAKFRIDQSATPRALLSPAMRRIASPGGALARGLGFDTATPVSAVIARANAGLVSAAPPRITPAGLATIDQAAAALAPAGLPRFLVDLLVWAPYLPALVLGVSLVVGAGLALFGGPVGMAAGAAVAAGGVWAYQKLTAMTKQAVVSQALREESMTPAMVDRMPTSANFRLTQVGQTASITPGGGDSLEATRFKAALKNVYSMGQDAAAYTPPNASALDLSGLAQHTVNALNPMVTVTQWVDAHVQIPTYIAHQSVGNGLVEAMCYPSFDLPMYKPLVERATELFLPNIHLIPENSLTLLETNQAFIEAYMVGLNHEFGRELLWRGYPTDQRGSCFRQFWDATSYFDTSGGDPVAARERLRDIPPIHRWPATSKLGDHDNRQTGGEARDEVVLVIRGELLAKYPTAVIYAHKARWQTNATTGAIMPNLERVPIELTAAEEAAPPTSLLKTPLYQAKVEPDIYFLGFDLTALEARGGSGDEQTDPAGWFFVIKERPSEPRFGLDIGTGVDLTPTVWNDLNWGTALPSGSILPLNRASTSALAVQSGAPSTADNEKTPQWTEDKNVSWGSDASSADIAYILYQAPVRVAVHGAEMLGSG